MHSFVCVLVYLALFRFTPSFARIPEYATRVRTEYRFPIPYPIPTGPWHTPASSSTPTSVSRDWSTPSDYSYWIIQTDNYSPSFTGLVEASSDLRLLNSLQVTMSDERDGASSTSTATEMMQTDGALMTAESIITDLPRGPAVTSMQALSSTTSARISGASSGTACNQLSISMMTIGAVAAVFLMSQP